MARASFGVSINLYEESERCSMIEVVPPFLALEVYFVYGSIN